LPSPDNHRIYFDHGTETLDQYYEVHQIIMDRIMESKGYLRDKNWVTRKFDGAEHNEKSWQQRMDVVLEFLYPLR
ncbi:esterase, partial [Nostoc linckia z15]